MLLKLYVPAGSLRTEVLQMTEIFRGKVVDVSDNTLTVCVTGDPGKVRRTRRRLRVSAVILSSNYDDGAVPSRSSSDLSSPCRSAPPPRRRSESTGFRRWRAPDASAWPAAGSTSRRSGWRGRSRSPALQKRQGRAGRPPQYQGEKKSLVNRLPQSCGPEGM